MSQHRKFPALACCVRIAALAVIASVGLLHGALADSSSTQKPKKLPAAASKCLCGYGISGYDNINCVPVKDCEWEHATCRGDC